MLSAFHEPLEDRVRIDLAHPGRAPNAQAFSQTRNDAHDELGRGALAMKNRAMGFGDIPVTGDTLQLAPELATRMSVGADVAAAEPAMVGTIRIATKVRSGVDSALAASREGDEGR